MRTMQLGAARTGKSLTMQAAVSEVRKIFGVVSVLVFVHTGVARFNAGCGAETTISVSKILGDGAQTPAYRA